MEAEYVALAECAKEVIFIKSILKELQIDVENTKIFCDNRAAIEIAKNPKDHQRAKHIDIKFHFIRKEIEEKTFELEPISSQENCADIFTKPLNANVFHNHCSKLGLLNQCTL